jgi:hypothetical protein
LKEMEFQKAKVEELHERLQEENKRLREKVNDLRSEVDSITADKAQQDEAVKKLKQQQMLVKDELDEKLILERTVAKLEARWKEGEDSRQLAEESKVKLEKEVRYEYISNDVLVLWLIVS